MAISRLAPTAVAASGLLAVAAMVIWFGILEPRRSAPEGKPVVGREADSRTPEPRRAQASPDAIAPTADARRPEPPAPFDAVPAASPQPSSVAREAPVAPSFDVVRVEPTGESVIAGRAAPGATVELLRNGKRHARVASDASGLFAFVPPPFLPGSHEVILQSTAPDGTRTQSRESITVSIAEKKDTKPLIALTTPGKPTVVLSSPDAPGVVGTKRDDPPARTAALPQAELPASGAAPPAVSPTLQPGATTAAGAGPRPQLRVATVEAEEGGRLFVSGEAAPGATVRLYLNDTLMAPGGAGADGRVAFAIGRGVRPGGYRVRLDDVDPATGEVKSRAEVEFRVPAPLAVELPPATQPYVTTAPRQSSLDRTASMAAPSTPAQDGPEAGHRQLDPGTVLIPEVNTASVSRGENLWRISKRVYGRGVRFTVIYSANQNQIRSPRLIYPGQVFVLPPDTPASAQR